MCGILGIIGKKVDESLFLSSLNRLSHRGPDGFGVWKNEDSDLYFGHRRLSIIDLSSNGKQPFSYMGYVLTFNGEIYNYLELRKELIAKGYSFNTESDSEVLIASYIEWGEKCLDKFNGMWALALYDKKRNSVLLSRDRFGKKPLFYYHKSGVLAFASEMKALAPFMEEVKIAGNFDWMVQHVSEYESTDKCLIKDVHRFPAGHYAYYNLSDRQINLKRYWNTLDTLVNVPDRYEEQVEQYRALFVDACKLRMRSDVAVGTALSGGLDSSGVICTMAHINKNVKDEKASHDWQHAFVACFPNSFLDERMYAEKVVNHLGIKANYLSINPDEGIDSLNDYLYYFEELYDTSPIPMAKIYHAMANDGVRVSMDGHGVDESFSGYGQSILEALLDTSKPSEIKQIIGTYRQLHPAQFTSADAHSDLRLYTDFMLKRKKTVARNIVKRIPVLNNLIPDGPIEKIGNFNYNLYLLFHQSILPTLLRNYDRYAMMNGVEIRMPFMDHRLISLAFSLPWQSKIRNGYTKSIIRDALKDFMPLEIVQRKQKIGFQTPILEYLKGPWKQYFADLIHSDAFKKSELVDAKGATANFKKIIESESATFMDARNFWMQVTPHLWEQAFFKRI